MKRVIDYDAYTAAVRPLRARYSALLAKPPMEEGEAGDDERWIALYIAASTRMARAKANGSWVRVSPTLIVLGPVPTPDLSSATSSVPAAVPAVPTSPPTTVPPGTPTP